MENSSLGPTQIPRRLANSRPIPGKSAPPAIPCIRGGTAVRESESFRKASGSFSFGNREPLPSPPLLGRIVISRAEKTTRVFHRRFVPRSGWTHSPFPAPVIATDRKQTGPRCSRLYRLSSARFLTSKIDHDFESGASTPRASNLLRSIWITRCGAQREGYERGFACKFKRCSSKYNCLVFVREEEKLDVLEARED